MMNTRWSAALALAVCVACNSENTSGLPESETTGTMQAAQNTSSATATTTGQTGGTSSALSPDDKEFISKAGMAGLYEVQVASLAVQKAANAEVKAFAQRMLADHGKANAELAQLATVKGAILPSELDGEPEDAIEHLGKLSGAEFDKAYMHHMTADHQKDVAEFERAASGATDADVKAFAGRTLPTLREHLQLATTVAGKV